MVYKDLGVATAKKCEQYEKLIKNGFFKPGVEMYTDFKSGILYLKYSQDLIRTQRW